jgi:flagellar protein FlgJ
MTVDIRPFIQSAQDLEKQTGIPASITLGQIMLESGGSYSGGLSGLATQGHNLFGIKANKSWLGNKITMFTNEVINGVSKVVPASFRAYNSYYDSMVDHADLLGKPRYAKYFENAKTVDDFITGIVKGGYATDPKYSSKLSSIISKNNLAQYDSGKYKFLGTGSLPATENGNGSNQASEKETFTTTLVEGVTRIVFILLLLILGAVFFMQAFPSVGSTATSIATKGLVK